MVFHRIKRINGKQYNYLIENLKFKGKVYQIQKYIGSGKINKKKIEEKKFEYIDWVKNKIINKKATLSSTIYKSDHFSKDQLVQLENIKFIFKEFKKNLHPNELEIIERDFDITYIHSTTATEGNTCTIAEVTHILEDSLSPKGRSLREIYEVRNFEKVLRYRKKYRGKISIPFILKLHELVMKDIDLYTIGTFRRIEVAIRGSETKPVPAIFIDEEMKNLLNWYDQAQKIIHPIELATKFHVKFEEIHPFTDGNGRVGREIFNFMVTKNEFPPLNFDITKRDEYLDGLEKANNGDFQLIIDYVIKNYLDQLRLRLGSSSLLKVLDL
jgi:Fic family protein